MPFITSADSGDRTSDGRYICNYKIYVKNKLACIIPYVYDDDSLVVFSFPKSGTHFIKELHYKLTNKTVRHDHCHHYSPFNFKILRYKYANKKIIFTYRDPRDCIISYLEHVNKLDEPEKTYFGHSDWNNWSTDRKIMEIILGDLVPILKYDVRFLDQLVRELPHWNNTCVVKFEDFIGPLAGGNEKRQIVTCRKIIEFITGKTFEDQAVKDVVKECWGLNATFNDPKISKWKHYFTDDIKETFKNSIWGSVLIDLGYEVDNNW